MADLVDSKLPVDPEAIPAMADGSWSDALKALAAALPSKPAVVVPDELPWLAEQDALFDGALPENELTTYVCGPTPFMQAVADLLVAAGHDPARVKPNDSDRQEDRDDRGSSHLLGWQCGSRCPARGLRSRHHRRDRPMRRLRPDRRLRRARVYLDAPGMVARCSGCDGVLLRVVNTPTDTYLDLRGLTYLRLSNSDN